MNTIIPEGDSLKKALIWIDRQRADNPEKKLMGLLDEAGMKFNLSPKDSDFLFRFYTKKE